MCVGGGAVAGAFTGRCSHLQGMDAPLSPLPPPYQAALAYAVEWRSRREGLGYAADGAVLKLDDGALQARERGREEGGDGGKKREREGVDEVGRGEGEIRRVSLILLRHFLSYWETRAVASRHPSPGGAIRLSSVISHRSLIHPVITHAPPALP